MPRPKNTTPDATDKPASAVLIKDKALLSQAHKIGAGRGDSTTAKVVQDLLRERLTELQINGDPLRIEATSAA